MPRFPFLLGAIAVGALVVRIAFVVIVDPTVPRVGDASAYHLLANNLADGRGYIRPFDFAVLERVRPTAEYPPLFPALLSVVSFVGVKSVEGQRLAMTLVGTGTVVVVGLLGRRVGGDIVGLVAAGLAAVYPMLFMSDGVLMAETPYVLLVAIALLLAYRAIDDPRPVNFVVLGAVIGASALTRAEGLLLTVLLVVPVAVMVKAVPARRRAELAAVGVATAALVVVPWTARNAIKLDAFVPVSNNVATAIDGANCDLVYSGDQLGLWRETFSTLGDEARKRPQAEACFEGFDIRARDFDEADVAAEHRSDGLEYAREHTGRLPIVMTARLLRTWALFRPSQQIEFESFEGRPERWLRIGTQMYWVLLPLALAGFVLVARRRRARVWPLLSTGVLVSLTTVVTYGQQRFRAADEPALVVLAAVAIVAIASRLRRITVPDAA
ncbi:MAG TPA: glycosyltransferase family 39 protein [Acidimicrobiia bacterium]|nr:glycosyltransferase family 39 protein [Acidimicrobiia bacterium]